MYSFGVLDMKKITLIIILTMISNFSIGQNLNGKWILKDVDLGNEKKSYPSFQLMDIKEKNVDLYIDFLLHKKVLSFRIDNYNFLHFKNEVHSSFKIINENHFKWFVKGKINEKDAIFEHDFYRLEPTITILKKEEIEQMSFILTENGRETKLEFKEVFMDKEAKEALKIKEGEKKVVEKIDSTFFVSMFWNGKRTGSIPIKEVTTDFLKLYAIPTGPLEMIAYRKK